MQQCVPQVIDSGKSDKSAIYLPLGTYKAARIPLIYFTATYAWVYYYTYSWTPDPRTQNLPLKGSFISSIVTVSVYVLLALTWGPKFMKSRDPIKPKRLMMAYNLLQVVVCSYVFIESGLAGWFFDYNWNCQPHDLSYRPKTLRMVAVVYMYYLTKILDFTDTVFLVLGKRWSSVSLLHVLHHSLMFLCSWQGVHFTPAGHLNFPVVVNSFVHVLMYSYYFLAALGPAIQPYLWWKKYLTTIQIVQFLIVFMHTMQIFFFDCPDVPKGFAMYMCFGAQLFTGLFVDFYIHEYRSKKMAKSS